MTDIEQILLSDELLAVMRDAARRTLAAREPFVTPRTLLLALLDDPLIGPALASVVPRERVEAIEPPQAESSGVARVPEDRLLADEQPALVRYDTLAFKTPEGTSSVWLNRDAFNIFIEGAQRAEESYKPKHLAFGFAAEAIRAPGVLAAVRVEPGRLTDAIYKL